MVAGGCSKAARPEAGPQPDEVSRWAKTAPEQGGRAIGELSEGVVRFLYKMRVIQEVDESLAPVLTKIDDGISEVVEKAHRADEGLSKARRIRRSVPMNPRLNDPNTARKFLRIEAFLRNFKSERLAEVSNLQAQKGIVRWFRNEAINTAAVYNPLPHDLSVLEFVGVSILGDSEYLPPLFEYLNRAAQEQQQDENLQVPYNQYNNVLFNAP